MAKRKDIRLSDKNAVRSAFQVWEVIVKDGKRQKRAIGHKTVYGVTGEECFKMILDALERRA